MNIVILRGHLGQDADSRKVNDKLTISNFTLATSRFVKGEKVTDWHNIKLFNHEKLVPYLKKGANFLVRGFTSTESWKGNDGNMNYKTVVTVDEIELLGMPQQPSDQTDGPY